MHPNITLKPEIMRTPNLVFYGLLSTKPISGRVDRASVTETIDSGSIPGWVKPKTIKLVFTAFLLGVQQLKGTV